MKREFKVVGKNIHRVDAFKRLQEGPYILKIYLWKIWPMERPCVPL